MKATGGVFQERCQGEMRDGGSLDPEHVRRGYWPNICTSWVALYPLLFNLLCCSTVVEHAVGHPGVWHN